MGGYSGGGTAGYPYATKESLRAALPEAVDPAFVIAVLDTGVTVDGPSRKPHPYVAPNLALGWADRIDSRETYDRAERGGYDNGQGVGPVAGPLDGHGTFVAGVILREAPFATLEIRNPLDGPTPPPVYDNESEVAKAIRGLAGVENLRLVNLGGYNVRPMPQAPAEIEAALQVLVDAHPDVAVVTSLSNDWADAKVWPAAFNAHPELGRNVIAVGAVDETPTPYVGEWRPPPKASFANWGGVDVWASGVSVLGPHLQPPDTRLVTGEAATGWVRWSGTPFATAAVTGMIARMLRYSDAQTPRQAFDRLVQPRPAVAVHGVEKAAWKPWLRARGSRWAEFPGV